MNRRQIAVLTTGRQDYGILRSIMTLLRADPRFDLQCWVGGMHLRERFGRTITQIRADGFRIDAELGFVAEPPSPVADASRAAVCAADVLATNRPDAILLLGDRPEVLAVALAATVATVPIAHLHGGEQSDGAVDNVVRHAITKLSHLHLVSHDRHAARVRQMGEDPATIFIVGAPGLDNQYRTDLPEREALETHLRLPLTGPVVLVTMHPTTLGGAPVQEVQSVAAAMDRVPATYVVSQPNADAGGAVIRDFWLSWARSRPQVAVVDALGEARFWGLLRLASAVLGNSSSGIIEAPEAGVPSVNVGDRQARRLSGRGVVSVPADTDAIEKALREAIRPETRDRVAEAPTLYPEGPAAPRAVEALASWQIRTPPRKAFWDLQ